MDISNKSSLFHKLGRLPVWRWVASLAVVVTAWSPVQGAVELGRVVLDLPSHQPMRSDSVRVLGDRVFVLFRDEGRLRIFNLTGEQESEVRIWETLGINPGLQSEIIDFEVEQADVVLYLVSVAGPEWVRLGLDGAPLSRKPATRDSFVSKLALGPDGLFALGEKVAARRGGELSILSVDPAIGRLQPVATDTEVAEKPASRVARARIPDGSTLRPFRPLLVRDRHGNSFFETRDGLLGFVNHEGDVRRYPLPATKHDVQILNTILISGDRLLLVFVEGKNSASQSEKLQGYFSLFNPVTRVCEFDARSGSYRDVYLGRDLSDVVGQVPGGDYLVVGPRSDRFVLLEAKLD